jgi:hypothetical protein
VLVCSGKMTKFRSPRGGSDGFTESFNCLQTAEGISFITPAKNCQFNVSVLTDSIVWQTSQLFEVVPGVAGAAVLLGGGPFCASAGAIVWSVNSTTDGLCLAAQLQDAEGNNITTATEGTVVARHLNSSVPNYQISRSASNTSSPSGLIRWCDAYSSRTHQLPVVFCAKI